MKFLLVVEDAEDSVTFVLAHHSLEVNLVEFAPALKNLLDVPQLDDVSLTIAAEHTRADGSPLDVANVLYFLEEDSVDPVEAATLVPVANYGVKEVTVFLS